MVTCIFVGRMGNNYFQEAAAIGLAKKHNTTYLRTENPNFLPIYKEPCFEYREIPYSGDICLSGYFQSEKYFSHCKEEIIEHFTKGWNREPINKISIHVRRGDYLNIECHPVVSIDYLSKAVQIFKNQGFEDKDFLVFSDDPNWCSQNLPYEISHGTELEDLELMSRCSNHIISNSSFSWWGCWLGVNPDKIVVAPKLWFDGSKKDVNTSDLYCEGWVII